MFRFPLGTEQRSVLFLDRLLGPGILHNLTAPLPVAPDTPPEAIEAALVELGRCHSGLRLLLADDDQRRQYVGAGQIVVDRSPVGAADPVARRAVLQARRLDRRTEPRACAELCPAGGGGSATLLLGFDHLICDASARATLLRDLSSLLATGTTVPPPSLSTVETYCVEQDRAIARGNLRKRECASWERTLDGCVPLAGLSDRSRSAPWQAVSWQREWPGGDPYRAVGLLTDSAGSSAFSTVSAALAIALWRASSAPTGAFITPISTRRRPEVADLVTNLVNERPIAYRVDPDMPFGALARNLGTSCLRAVRDSWLAIPDLVDGVAVVRGMFHAPGAEYVQLQVDLAGPSAAPVAPASSTTLGRYAPGGDITCTVIRVLLTPDRTRVNAFYGGPVDGGDWVIDLVHHLVSILGSLPADPDVRAGHLADLTTWQRRGW